MVLCPTQSPRLASDLMHALGCVMETCEYDWCELVLCKLMDSICSFARRFYANGYAGGCGGCAMFVVIYYLDRLNRDLIQWGVYPRIKVWNMKQIWKAGKCDRLRTGDYGCLGVLDVAYGEYHPREARDTEGPMTKTEYPDMSKMEGCKDRRRRAPIQAT
ncbi:uncharacterized protein LOC110694316 isoform X3 [Chenopodium quinoa]|uniref:uncharacterized protein LOC110694316 isoform X3 n=1 Tax=Chenopodium quinoa TaxID=63459 RepID=UPI000B76E584|nr:uncharacterized protein LOC110694316 isoform X3 [Chenopodium quinoa]